MSPPRRIILMATALAVAAPLYGCGKAGRPTGPPDSPFPQHYPATSLGPKPTPAVQKDGRALPPEWDNQDLKEAFGPASVYIDPSARGLTPTITAPSNLLTGGQSSGASPIDQGLGAASGSPLPPVLPSFPEPR